MSEKQATAGSNCSNSKIFKWFLYGFIVIILEALAISGAVFINESRNKSQTLDIIDAQNTIKKQEKRITLLEELPTNIKQLSSDIQENKGSIQLFQQNLENLKEEVGNKKIDIITEKLVNISHRMESVEENKNIESLILSIALLIKENAMYGRNFSYEVNILEQMAKEQNNISNEINILKDLANHTILSDNLLIEQITLIADNFDFEKPIKKQTHSKDDKNVVSKSLNKIKDTVANINFDKVVIMKKNNNTPEQKLLLSTLLDLMHTHQFAKASLFVENNPQFANAENKNFNNWLINLKNKISFDEAISKIISSELNLLRETITNKTISLTNQSETPEIKD